MRAGLVRVESQLVANTFLETILTPECLKMYDAAALQDTKPQAFRFKGLFFALDGPIRNR